MRTIRGRAVKSDASKGATFVSKELWWDGCHGLCLPLGRFAARSGRSGSFSAVQRVFKLIPDALRHFQTRTKQFQFQRWAGQIPIIPFYKRGCQDKCLPCDGETQGIVSIGLRIYLHFYGSHTATYGSLGGVIVLLLYFYLGGVAVLSGGALNAVMEELASPRRSDSELARKKQSQ